MKWIVCGANGMLGTDLVKRLERDGYEVVAVDRPDIDITDPASVDDVVRDGDVLVNVAAYTAVDPAEENENVAFLVNATGPQILARRCKELGIRLVHISTDYVFDGDQSEPYDEYAILAPKGAYGRTKAAGEWAVRSETDDYLIVRTAWLYGAAGNCFPKTMQRLASTRDSLSVVTDEIGQPTWTVDLADLVVRLVEAKAPTGIYHGTSQGRTSWHEFTCEIVESLGKDRAMVRETTAAAFNRPAPRPHFSVLGHQTCRDAGVEPIGDWRERWHAAANEVLGLDAE